VILGLGIDVVDVARIARLHRERGEAFLARVFTPAEIEAALRRKDADFALASRFAAKEAAMKALGTGWALGVGFRDVEVAGEFGVRPRLHFHGGALERARTLGVTTAHVSLTHDGSVAVAAVILEGREPTEPDL
jgi:holo-[acyl-carrier protein] synthase